MLEAEGRDATLPTQYDYAAEDGIMVRIRCQSCEDSDRSSNRAEVAIVPGNRFLAGMELTGILSCNACQHRWPITIRNDWPVSVQPDMPVHESAKLVNVPPGIEQDGLEAETCHFHEEYKASVVMCRRAMQLSLIEQGIIDRALTAMLTEAKTKGLIDDKTYGIAWAVKDYGDMGAHRIEELGDSEARTTIFATVVLLNHLFSATP